MKKHFSATVYITSKIDGEYKVLLHKHKKLGIWVAIGGHIEEHENPVQALLRETKEETNLEISLIKMPAPVAILEEKVPQYKDEPSHIHWRKKYPIFQEKLYAY